MPRRAPQNRSGAERPAPPTGAAAKSRGTVLFVEPEQALRAKLENAASDAGYMATIGPALYQRFMARGLLVRPLGNTIYIMPPYCSTEGELDLVYEAIGEIADEIA